MGLEALWVIVVLLPLLLGVICGEILSLSWKSIGIFVLLNIGVSFYIVWSLNNPPGDLLTDFLPKLLLSFLLNLGYSTFGFLIVKAIKKLRKKIF